jgi:hypothetical protein
MTTEEPRNQEEIDSSLMEEIAEFNRERQRIKDVIGRVGGVQYSRAETIVNVLFIILVVGFFILEATLHPFPTTVSVEIGLFLVSLKIVWMIHANQKFNHFLFWILNTVEYRLNTNAKTLEDLRVALEELKKQSNPSGSTEAER